MWLKVLLASLCSPPRAPRPSRRVVLQLEALETRLAPATRIDARTVIYRDLDGDNVTVKLSQSLLTDANVATAFTFNAALGAEQLRSIDLSGLGGADGLGITATAKRSAANGGDGLVNVGQLLGGSLDLGKVIFDGDLGKIDVTGDVTSLAVQSLGRFGIATGASDLKSDVAGRLGTLAIKSDMVAAKLAAGSIGAVTVRGSLLSALLASQNGIDSAAVGGDLVGAFTSGGSSLGPLVCSGTLARLTVGGSLIGTADALSGFITASAIGSMLIKGDVVGGAGTASGRIACGGRISGLTIGGSVRSGSGLESGTIRPGELGTVLIQGSLVGSSQNRVAISGQGKFALPANAPKDVAIDSVTVKGRVQFADILGGFDLTGDPENGDAQIGSIVVGGDWIASNAAAGVDPVDGKFGNGNDVPIASGSPQRFSKIGTITIAGQVLGTLTPNTDAFGFVSQEIGFFSVAGTLFPLTLGKSNDLSGLSVGATGDVNVREV